jgi:hypothetical protein
MDEVHGPGSVQHSDYHPTIHELKVIAKYWLEQELSVCAEFWFSRQVGSHEWRLELYASRRVARIADIIGEEEIKKLVREVEEEERQRIGDEAWDAFCRDDQEWLDRKWRAACEDESGNPTAAEGNGDGEG